MLSYLPLALGATISVVLLPVVLAALIVPRGGAVSMLASAAASIVLSVAIAGIESSLWKRVSRSRDITFSELMLWGWLRRAWAERGLAERRQLYESARRIGPTVSVDQLERLSRMLEARDSYTHGHSRRVARHAARIATQMKLPAEEVAKIRTAAAVHDVGKIYTPREILNNPGRLTDAEFEVVKRHAADGGEMLATVGNPEIAAMVRHHHERMDGSGYPDRLSGEQIPLGARIIAVADTFDALTSNRAYRGANTHRRALRIIAAESGAQLDRDVVDAFASRYSSRRSVALLALAAIAPERIFAGLQSASTSIGGGAGGLAGGFGSIIPALGASGLLALSPAAAQIAGRGATSARQRPAVAQTGPEAPGAQAAQTTASAQSGLATRAATKTRRSRSQRPLRTGPRRGGGGATEGSPSQAQGGTGTGQPSSSGSGQPGGSARTPAASPPASSSKGQSREGSPNPAGEGSGSQEGISNAPPPSGSSTSQTGLSEVVSGTTQTVAGTTKAALSGATSTLEGTTAALSGPKPLPEAATALVSGATETLTETTGTLLSGVAKTLSGLTGSLLGGSSAAEQPSQASGQPTSAAGGAEQPPSSG